MRALDLITPPAACIVAIVFAGHAHSAGGAYVVDDASSTKSAPARSAPFFCSTPSSRAVLWCSECTNPGIFAREMTAPAVPIPCQWGPVSVSALPHNNCICVPGHSAALLRDDLNNDAPFEAHLLPVVAR